MRLNNKKRLRRGDKYIHSLHKYCHYYCYMYLGVISNRINTYVNLINQFDNSQVGIFEGTNTMSSALSLLQRNNHTQIESIPDWKHDVMTVYPSSDICSHFNYIPCYFFS